MKEAVILVRKSQSERIFEIISAMIRNKNCTLTHTGFDYFDTKEVAAIILSAPDETLMNIKKFLKGEFSDSAFWMQPIISDDTKLLE